MSERHPNPPPEDIPPEHRERAETLRAELLVLEARLETATFDEKEAYRRAIDERRSELEGLRGPTRR